MEVTFPPHPGLLPWGEGVNISRAHDSLTAVLLAPVFAGNNGPYQERGKNFVEVVKNSFRGGILTQYSGRSIRQTDLYVA
jgi:hypothetical protein